MEGSSGHTVPVLAVQGQVAVAVRFRCSAALLRAMQEHLLVHATEESKMTNSQRRREAKNYRRGFANGLQGGPRSDWASIRAGYDAGHRAGSDERAAIVAARAETERRRRVALDYFHKGQITRDELNANFGTPKAA